MLTFLFNKNAHLVQGLQAACYFIELPTISLAVVTLLVLLFPAAQLTVMSHLRCVPCCPR